METDIKSYTGENTTVHHPDFSPQIWEELIREGKGNLLVTKCCNVSHIIPLWAVRHPRFIF